MTSQSNIPQNRIALSGGGGAALCYITQLNPLQCLVSIAMHRTLSHSHVYTISDKKVNCTSKCSFEYCLTLPPYAFQCVDENQRYFPFSQKKKKDFLGGKTVAILEFQQNKSPNYITYIILQFIHNDNNINIYLLCPSIILKFNRGCISKDTRCK